MKISPLIALLLTVSIMQAQTNLNIVPMPAEVKMGKGFFIIDKNTVIVFHGNDDKSNAVYLSEKIKKLFGLNLITRKLSADDLVKPKGRNIFLSVNEIKPEEPLPDFYSLEVSKESVQIRGDEKEGVFYGIQTLIQLLPTQKESPLKNNYKLSIPQLSIQDYSRFSYRGLHLDVARHFMPVSFVKKYIDYLAAYKFNTFHWHLTDDQGWRIEIKKYPKLTSVGAWRNGTIIGRYPGNGNDSLHYGGFYTQQQIKEVVKYAADRYINVIPEIEMPGHASAAIAAYPQLSCFPEEDTKCPAECVWAGSTKGKQVQQTWGVFEDVFCPSDYTFNFLQDVLDEVMPLFPSQYIHIGGDESPKESWKRSAFCQQLIKEKGLKNEHELQSYFIQRIEKHINSKGKKIIGWDEILEGGLAPNATVMSWRGEQGGIDAAKQNHDVIMTPGDWCYLDHSQTKNEDSVTIGGYLPVEKVYGYDPIPAVLSTDEAKHILGAQGNLWSEYLASPAKVEYMIFPRIAALAEVLWTQKENKDWKDFERRLPVIFERLDKQKVNYSKAYYELEATVLPTENFEGVYWALKIKDTLCEGRVIKIERFSQPQIIPVFDRLGNITGNRIVNEIADDIGVTDVQTNNVKINSTGEYVVDLVFHSLIKRSAGKRQSSVLKQQFHFNKATGKKITLTNIPSPNYPGSGAFTLVDGVQNDKGFAKSAEFIGFNGTDCEAIIDLGKTDSISKATIHALNDKEDWIWPPQSAEIFTSADGTNFTIIASSKDFKATTNGNGTITISFNPTSTRFIKLLIKNHGTIPEGNAGAGNPAWLFVDEVEVE